MKKTRNADGFPIADELIQEVAGLRAALRRLHLARAFAAGKPGRERP